MVKRKKRKNILKENYSNSWDFLKESKNFIYAIMGIFALFILLGAFIQPPAVIEQRILELIQELISQTQGMSQGQLTSFIFFNNVQVSFFGMVLGIFFGIFPIISTMVNGYIVGFVSSKSVEAAGLVTLWNLVPHGIFELPALFISLGLGLKMGTFIFRDDKVGALKKFLKESLRVFVFVIVPLLVIAAIIEGALIFFGS